MKILSLNQIFENFTKDNVFDYYNITYQKTAEHSIKIFKRISIVSMIGFSIGFYLFLFRPEIETSSKVIVSLLFSAATSAIFSFIGLYHFNLFTYLFPDLRKETKKFKLAVNAILPIIKNEEFQHMVLLHIKSITENLTLNHTQETEDYKKMIDQQSQYLRNTFISQNYEHSLQVLRYLDCIFEEVSEKLEFAQKTQEFENKQMEYKKNISNNNMMEMNSSKSHLKAFL